MKHSRYAIGTLGAATALAVFTGGLTDAPSPINPYSVPLFVVTLLVGEMLGLAAQGGEAMRLVGWFVSIMAAAASLILWPRGLLRGEAQVPRRSVVALMIVFIGALVWIITTFSGGVRFLGLPRTLLGSAVSLAPPLVMLLVARLTRGHDSYARNLALHWSGSFWLLNLAFPWIGEVL